MCRTLCSFARKATSPCLGAPPHQAEEPRRLPKGIALITGLVLLLALAPSASALVLKGFGALVWKNVVGFGHLPEGPSRADAGQ